jgi:predicted Zn-dependent protease
MREAVSLWNKQAGCTLFQISKESPIIKVKQGTIEVGTETEDWGAGAFVNKETTRGKIIVYVPLMVGTDLQVLHHELGHILGLAHDTSHTMKPIIKEEIGGRQAMVRAQDKDIEALNARYCGGKKDS